MAGEASYDPRTWPAAWGAPPPPAGPATIAAAPQWRRPSLAIGVAALLLFAAAIVWWHRASPVASVVPGTPGAAATGESPAPAGPKRMRRTLVLSGAGDLRAALVSNGVGAPEAEAAAKAAQSALQADGEVRAALTLEPEGAGVRLVRLEASNPDSSGAVVTARAGGGFDVSKVSAQLHTRIIVKRGRMDADSFYSSAVAAGISDSLIPEFAKALAFDFDFQREVKLGDVFEGAFEQETNASGEPVGPPRLLYAELDTATKSAAVYRFAERGGAPEWFDASGRSIIRALLRTPVDGARVSSTFGYRIHPIDGFRKLHKGTDFAAPIGTPIFASGNGVVQFAAMKGPNGNLTILHHDNGWLTYYLHQSRFMPGIVVGARVAQGQEIGEVGTTGHSTGPHLHYEVHIDGEPVDSMTIQTEQGRTLTGPALVAFGRERDRIDVSRAGNTE